MYYNVNVVYEQIYTMIIYIQVFSYRNVHVFIDYKYKCMNVYIV